MYFWLLDEDDNEIVAGSSHTVILKALDELVDKFDLDEYTVLCEFFNDDMHRTYSNRMSVKAFVDHYMPL